ncbi:MAG: type II toxin-antitoxin system RelE/ParE family toxin [Acidimicrobiaceae bacterium]|nr:type II toxin-antitoxin system RelE/ParE family toxin [Acidimicrobiaceae bacterium]
MAKLTRRGQRDLEKLPEPIRKKALEIIRRLDQNPAMGKKLLGALAGKRVARLGRAHRIIYTAEGGVVTVLTVRPRRDVYR